MIVALLFYGHGKIVPPQLCIRLPTCSTSLPIDANGIGAGLLKTELSIITIMGLNVTFVLLKAV
jgi:hypothetical protein